jgi:membrane-associated protein
MFDAESLIRYGGLLLVFVAVYAQTGLFFCFFLPSGALMFTTGVFVASDFLHYNIIMVIGLVTMASILGSSTGYWLGRNTAPLLYSRKNSRFFKKKHLKAAEIFYNKYGKMALIGAPFFPIVRTFAPIVAGMIKTDFKQFILFTIIGSAAWVISFVLAGYLIGSMPFLRPYLKYIVLAIILIVTIPLLIKIIKEFRKQR